jgi:hypothetical protein
MKRFLAVSVVLICVSGMLSAADPQLVGLMMPDAKVLAGVNIVQAKASPYGQYLLSQIPLADPNFQQFVQATGFDPNRDITEIVAASANPQNQSGLVAARGTFDVAHLVAFAKSTGAQVDESSGVPVLPSPDGKGAIALLSNTLAVMGDVNSVAAAVARRSNPSTLDPVLTGKAATLSGSEDAWAVSTLTPGAVGLPAPKGQGGNGSLNFNALQGIQQSSAGVKFGTSANVMAEAVLDTPQNASALAGLVQMLATLGQTNPQAAQVATVLETLSVQTKGTTVSLTLAIPEAVLEQLSPTRHAVRTRKVAERK